MTALLTDDRPADIGAPPEREPLYFGCWREIGHFFWRPGMRHAHFQPAANGLPWDKVDQKLTPKASTRQGDAALHVRDGWTAIAAHDYSVDSRPGSNSVFFLPGEMDWQTAITAAGNAFPEVIARMGPLNLNWVNQE